MFSLDSNPLQHPQPGSWLPHSIAPIPARSRKLIAPTEQFDTLSSPLAALRLQKQHAQTGPCSQGAGTGPVEASPRRLNPYQPLSRQETDEALPTRGGPLPPSGLQRAPPSPSPALFVCHSRKESAFGFCLGKYPLGTSIKPPVSNCEQTRRQSRR
jgi:hypothetical protein